MDLISLPLFLAPEKYGTQQRVGRIVWRENTVNLPGNVGREGEFSNVVFPGRIIIIIRNILFVKCQCIVIVYFEYIS